MKNTMAHFSPEAVYTTTSPESKEIKKAEEVEFVIDAGTGKIVKIGDPRDVRDWLRAQKSEQPDLQVSAEQGGIALPGFIDSHHHLLYGTLDVTGAQFIDGGMREEEIKKFIRNGIKKSDKDVPQIFLGHNTANAPDIYCEQLDEASPDKPVALLDASFHGARLNSPMFKILSAVAEKEKKQGRRITGILNGKNGQATEGYSILALQVVEAYYGIEKVKEGMTKQIESMIKQGITGMHDMFSMGWNDFVATMMARKEWEKKTGTEFPVRQVFLSPDLAKQLFKRQSELEKSGLFDPQRDWDFIGMKLVADGSFGSHTALLKEPYGGKAGGGKGMEFDSVEEINKAIVMARDQGINRIAMHAIGDAGVKRALATAKKWKKLAEDAKIDPSKFRIEHFELPGEEAVREAGEMGLWVSSQPNFLTDYVYEDRLSGRVTHICPHADMLQKGIQMHFGSDGMPTSALFGIWAATHHPNPKQRISFEQALAAYSLMGADYEHENGRGRIIEGAPADIVVLKKETLDAMLPGEGDPKEFKEMGASSASGKVAQLEAGIAKIYRQGRLVDK